MSVVSPPARARGAEGRIEAPAEGVEQPAEDDEGADGVAKWWWCLEHKAVEGSDGCRPADRLGPYDTEAEAARALEKVAERNAAWDSDPDWNSAGESD